MLLKVLFMIMSNNTNEGKNLKKYLPMFVIITIAGSAISGTLFLLLVLKMVYGVGMITILKIFLILFLIIGGFCLILYEEIKTRKNVKRKRRIKK